MRYTKKLCRTFLRNREGSVLIVVAISLGLLITASGIAYEMSKYTKVKARFANALDQAVLAAAAANPENPTDYAQKYFISNLSQDGLIVKLSKFEFNVNADHTEWSGTARGNFDTAFSSIIGRGSLNLEHYVKVAWDNRTKTELVAMVDVSGTMCANFQRSEIVNGSRTVEFIPDRSCNKLHMMKDALTNITKIGVGYSGQAGLPAAYEVGIVPYSFKVRLPHPELVPSFMVDPENAAGYDNFYYTNLGDAELNGPPLPEVTPLTPIEDASGKAALLQKIDQLASADNAEFDRPFMKRSSLGAQVAGLLLDPRYTNVFGGIKPVDFGTPQAKKVLIMMTDSANLGCCFTNWPEGNFRNHYIYSYRPDHEALVGKDGQSGICKQLKDAGVEIYSVLLDVNRADMDARGAEIVDAYQACASGPDHSFEIGAGDTDALKEAYTVIGRSLISLRISE
jgi:hypothetical protein